MRMLGRRRGLRTAIRQKTSLSNRWTLIGNKITFPPQKASECLHLSVPNLSKRISLERR
jgi:hypothetical protein